MSVSSVKSRKNRKILFFIRLFAWCCFGYLAILTYKSCNLNLTNDVGDVVDEFNGVSVYHNGGVDQTHGRNLTNDGYNLGIRYQCVEFVKRYYFEYYQHKMPDSYGHAKSFYDPSVRPGELNKQRDLYQYSNGGNMQPKVGDIVIFEGTTMNSYGHVAIVSQVQSGSIEIIQQNPGPFSSSREAIGLHRKDGKWWVDHERVLGWLRK